MKQEEKGFIIGTSSYFIAVILIFIETAKILEPDRFLWVSGKIHFLLITGIIIFSTIPIGILIKAMRK